MEESNVIPLRCDLSPSIMKTLPEKAAVIKDSMERVYLKLVRCQERSKLFKVLQFRKLGTTELEHFMRNFFRKQGRDFGVELGGAKQIGRDKIVKLMVELQNRV